MQNRIIHIKGFMTKKRLHLIKEFKWGNSIIVMSIYSISHVPTLRCEGCIASKDSAPHCQDAFRKMVGEWCSKFPWRFVAAVASSVVDFLSWSDGSSSRPKHARSVRGHVSRQDYSRQAKDVLFFPIDSHCTSHVRASVVMLEDSVRIAL